ncbi:MAG: amidohydrolase family protein [Clostridia bacterium]|nr:amidohydrolase family protein [Clostridia bacterium]
MKAIINVTIYDYLAYHPSSYVIFDKQIVAVGSMKNFKTDQLEIIDGQGMLLLPGLINFHTHIYSTLVRGLAIDAEPKDFKGILEDLWWRFDRQLTLEDLFASAVRYGEASLRAGVTAVIDHNASGAIDGSLEALRKGIKETLGMKGLFCFETSDRFNVDHCIEENLRGIANGDGLFGLHASMTLSDETLSRVEKVLGETPIHIHVAESTMDEDKTLSKHHMSVVHRLGRYNLLNPGSLLAHCVHIDDEEAALMAQNKCYVAINPSSNMNNAVGSFKYEKFRSHNIGVLVGTDGLGVNIARAWQDLYYLGKNEMRDPSGISLDEIRHHIIQSYVYYGQVSGHKVGRIEADYDADMMLIDYKAPTPMNEANVFAHIFYGVYDNLRPRHLFIEGKKKIEHFLLLEGFSGPYEKTEALWEKVRREPWI